MSMFEPLQEIRPYELGEGITARAVNGERMTMAVVDLAPNAILAEHQHENEQLGFVVKGSMTMRIGDEMRELRAGDTYTIPSNMPHGAAAGPEGCTATDVFAPTRADWERLERSEARAGDWP